MQLTVMILEPSIWIPIVSAPFQFVPLDRMYACEIDLLAKLIPAAAIDLMDASVFA